MRITLGLVLLCGEKLLVTCEAEFRIQSFRHPERLLCRSERLLCRSERSEEPLL